MKIRYLHFIRLALLMTAVLLPKSQAYANDAVQSSISKEDMYCAALVDHYEQEQIMWDQINVGLN